MNSDFQTELEEIKKILDKQQGLLTILRLKDIENRSLKPISEIVPEFNQLKNRAYLIGAYELSFRAIDNFKAGNYSLAYVNLHQLEDHVKEGKIEMPPIYFELRKTMKDSMINYLRDIGISEKTIEFVSKNPYL